MNCPHCDNPISSTDSFCPNCGRDLGVGETIISRMSPSTESPPDETIISSRMPPSTEPSPEETIISRAPLPPSPAYGPPSAPPTYPTALPPENEKGGRNTALIVAVVLILLCCCCLIAVVAAYMLLGEGLLDETLREISLTFSLV